MIQGPFVEQTRKTVSCLQKISLPNLLYFQIFSSEAMKIMSSAALGAIFFSTSTPMPTSDPDCFPPEDPLSHAAKAVTVGLAAWRPEQLGLNRWAD